MLRILTMNLTAQAEIIAGGVSGKGHEILVEVRLVVIAGLVRHLRPIDRLGGVNTFNNVFEAVKPRQIFGCASHEPLELCSQVILTHAHLVAQRSNRERTVLGGNLLEGIADCL